MEVPQVSQQYQDTGMNFLPAADVGPLLTDIIILSGPISKQYANTMHVLVKILTRNLLGT